MTRPRHDPPSDWRTARRLLTRAQVAAILTVSANRVQEMAPPLPRRTPRRTRWSPDVILAITEGRDPSTVPPLGFLAGLPAVLTEAEVAHVLVCPGSTVPWLTIAPLPAQGRGGVRYARADLQAWLEAPAR